MSQDLYVVTNQSGIIVAVAPCFTSGETTGGILPVAGHTLHQINRVDPKILALTDPEEFHELLTKHFNSSTARLTIDDPETHVFETLLRPMREPFSKFSR